MKFLCPTCRTPLPPVSAAAVVPCAQCGVAVDLTRVDTAPGSSALSPEVDLSGEALGRYQLGERLGSGGMGAVYAGASMAGPCAVKVLASTLGAEPSLRERFKREAKALRAVEHPGVVRVFEEGEERGFCWYAMERVKGPDLRARLKEGPLPAREVEALARQLLSALEAVHGHGLVHRDVKPGNILLAPEGAKLCDFGIARFDGSTTLTESAALMGSLRYMAPEQRRGVADARSDLYALGLSLYEALAGGLPDEVKWPAAPARLRKLVESLLREKPEERPVDAKAALGWLSAPPWRARPVETAVAAGAVLVLALGGVGGVRVWRTPATAPPAPVAAQALAAPKTKEEPPPPNPVAVVPQAQQVGSSPADESRQASPQGLNTFGTTGNGIGGLGGLGTKGMTSPGPKRTFAAQSKKKKGKPAVEAPPEPPPSKPSKKEIYAQELAKKKAAPPPEANAAEPFPVQQAPQQMSAPARSVSQQAPSKVFGGKGKSVQFDDEPAEPPSQAQTQAK